MQRGRRRRPPSSRLPPRARRCVEVAPGGRRGGVPHHGARQSNGRSAAGTETRGDSGELRKRPPRPRRLPARRGATANGEGTGGRGHGSTAPRGHPPRQYAPRALRRLHDGPCFSSGSSPSIAYPRSFPARSPIARSSFAPPSP